MQMVQFVVKISVMLNIKIRKNKIVKCVSIN